MGPTFWTFVIAIVVPVTTFFTTWMTLRYTGNREEGRLEHEKSLKVLELQSQRQDKNRDERIAAYRTLLVATKTVDPRAPYEFKDLIEAESEIRLVSDSPFVLGTANELVAACNDARRTARNAYKRNRWRNPLKVPGVRQAVERKEQAWEIFVRAAIQDRQAMSTVPVERTSDEPLPSEERIAETSRRSWWIRVLFGDQPVERGR